LKEHHEPIIDRDLWNRTQEELKRRSPSEEQKSKHSNRYWCSGKFIVRNVDAVMSAARKINEWRCL
jgi:hypothetical protein